MKKFFLALPVALAFASVSLQAAPTLKRAVTAAAGSASKKSNTAGDNVAFSWDANPVEQQASGYKFYEATGGVYRLLGAIAGTGFTVSAITAGTHHYVVTAYRDADSTESSYSNEVVVDVTAPLPPLSPPTNLQKVASGIANVSARAQVGVGENVLIAGLIITGEKTPVIVRAIGPTLQQAGVNGALIDPTLELHNSQGETIAVNDNWQDTQKTEITDIGLAPVDYRESAISTSLEPGAYTAVLRGKYGTTGVALVEVYRG